MNNQLSQIKWVRVLLTALVVYILSFLAVFIVVTVYASYLGFQARGAPDQAMIEVFANQYAPWIGLISVILFTTLGAIWISRRVGNAGQLHGLVLGVLVSLVNILFDGISTINLVTALLAIAAGWLGGQLGARK